MPIIHFADTHRKVECVPGANLREVAIRERYQVYKGIYRLINCHGHGLCGSCKVAVLEGRTMPRNATEKRRLKKVPEPWRLACQMEVLDNITVTADEAQVAEFVQAREIRRREAETQAAVAAHAATAAQEKVEAAHEAEEAQAAAERATQEATAAAHEAKVAREMASEAPLGETRTAVLAAAHKAHEAAAVAMREAGRAREAAQRAKDAAAAGDEHAAHAAELEAKDAVSKALAAEAAAAAEAKNAKILAERAAAQNPKGAKARAGTASKGEAAKPGDAGDATPKDA